MALNVGELIDILSAVQDKEREVQIMQPRSWTKKANDEARTNPYAVEIGAGYVRIKTCL